MRERKRQQRENVVSEWEEEERRNITDRKTLEIRWERGKESREILQ